MKRYPPEIRAHQEWLGFVQPVGLVVSLPALEKAQCFVEKNIIPQQEALRSIAIAVKDGELDRVPSLAALCEKVLDWNPGDLSPAPEAFSSALPEHQDSLQADFVAGDVSSPVLLVSVMDPAQDFDAPLPNRGWIASPEARLERLLRDRGVPIGVLFNQRALRLVYAPSGESSGHVTFTVRDMLTVAGRPILGGLLALLGVDRLFNLQDAQRLPAILAESREHQSEVSTRLSEQVLGALHTLVRGFQAADDATDGALLREVLRESPEEVYGGLLTTLLRLVFVLYAEDRGLLAIDPVYARHYAVGALFEKLEEDKARYPDTMDQRYGAWARLLTLFRVIHDGARHGNLRLPPRYGDLFDPDKYPFLEGRPVGVARQLGERLLPPRVSDGVVHKVLESLLMLDGERLSYRTLDVEQIGSVYEAMMGFSLITVHEPSIALSGKRKKGAPPSDPLVGLESLLGASGAARLAKLKEDADVELPAKAAAELKAATSIEGLIAALGNRISPRSPGVIAAGQMALEPTEERRRSGSHYTPRSLTEPIVKKALEPVLAALGPQPTPSQILSLKICDPAMGSGAFLVAACRELGDRLLASWQVHGMPSVPADEDPILFARRTVAQRCLYGVDKNPFAVHLAKLSLWLVTLAKDHPFTFLDHALRCGDALVGLSLEEIAACHWAPASQRAPELISAAVSKRVARALELRERIAGMSSSDDTIEKRRLLEEASAEIEVLRRLGNRVVEAFFSATKPREREAARVAVQDEAYRSLERLAGAELKIRPFHWPLEFPEVFSKEKRGFDVFVGNPPFSGKNGIAQIHASYLDWLKTRHDESHGNADLVAHFFRRTFDLLRPGGTLGLIATNTIAQGDTRSTGLRWIVKHGGVIYQARRRYKWPAGAAVIVSVVHIAKGPAVVNAPLLDGVVVPRISAFLFHTGPDDDPVRLAANAGKSFQGSIVLGMGFTFDDTNDEATPIAEMERLIAKDPRNRERIFPYLGGEELNTSPTHAHHRYVINFGQMSEEEARAWPDLIKIVEQKVKPQRQAQNREVRAKYWWRFGETAPALQQAVRGMKSVLAIPFVGKWHAPAFVPADTVVAGPANVIAFETFRGFCVLQSRTHEVWTRFLTSSLEDRFRYTPSDCFEPFPFPPAWHASVSLNAIGQTYYEFRSALMIQKHEGLTETYNRFHDPDERDPQILKLRERHAEMDRAVLDAYGWTDLKPTATFLLDHEDESDEEEESGKKRKKKPWRYRWPDDVRDEVLARLLALNAERAEEERRLGQEARLQMNEIEEKSAASLKAPKRKRKGPGNQEKT